MAGLDGCGKLDITDISHDNIVVIGNKVWIKADVEEKIWIYKDRPCTVIKFDDACLARMCSDRDPIPRGLLGAVEVAQILDCENADGGGGGGSESGDPDKGNERKAKTIRDGVVAGENKEKLQTAKTAVDIRSINAMGFQATAVIPSAAIIPMRSNIRTYGPYASSNFGSSCGGTQVEVNTDLAPWVFGSVGAMNGAGQSIVESSAIGLIKAETGGITIPGLPVSQFDRLGASLGGGGATLSSMNFSYGSGGISTSYEFKTYTPKFGGLNRHLIDRIKDISKNRTEQLRFLRNQQILLNKTGRKLQRFNQRFARGGNPLNNAPNNGASLQRVLIGEIYDWQKGGQRTVVGIDTMHQSVSEMVYDFDKKAYMSWDLIFGPMSKKGDGGLPRYASFEVDCHKSSPEYPNPPFAISSENSESSSSSEDPFVSGLDQYNLEITQEYLDPLTNNFEDGDHHHPGSGRGHVIDLVGGGTEVPQQGLITNFYNLDDENRYDDDYRFLGMRGPILLQSWGYDTQGKPIPNQADVENDTKEGKFKTEKLKDEFLSDWLGKPTTWPVAPIDFRFDRKRGVWVTPPGYRVVVAELKEDLDPYGTAEGQLINEDKENDKKFGPKLFDKDGEEVKATDEEESEAVIKITERLGEKYSSGTRAYCYYDTFSCEYIILNAKPKQSIRFRLIDLCENTPVDPDYGDKWTKYAGYGDKFPNNHILGIRINCEGDTIDSKGDFIGFEDIVDEDMDDKRRKEIFINLFDTCGKFGPANAYLDADGGQEAFNKWKQEAATGFGLVCDPQPENTCLLGEQGNQCSIVNDEYDSYDIIFLDGYARFVECELTQKLYSTEEDASEQYSDDEYKKENPEGNAAAEILEFYGHAGNGIEPKFYENDGGGLKEVEFRVFDPFTDYPKEKNPFIKLDEGDKVLAVFDETRKKYIIYNALKSEEKVIKFALVDNKNPSDEVCRAVLVDVEGYPIDSFDNRLNEDNFADNFITVFDGYILHGNSDPNPKYNNFGTTAFGPALGSDNFDEHINGIPLFGGDQAPPQDGNSSDWTGGPFIGFAISRPMPKEDSSASSEYEMANEMFFLESFAQIVEGKIASTQPIIESTYYLGALKTRFGQGGFIDGRIPFTRYGIDEDATKRANLRIRFPLEQHAAGKYITGDFYEEYDEGKQDVYNQVDGCKFVAKLEPMNSRVDSSEEKLFYTIIEVENIANRGKTVLTKKEKSDELNKKEVKEKKEPSDGIISEYLDGFMWDKEKSQKKYEKTTILNREDWVGKALIMKWTNENNLHIRTSLAGYDLTEGAITYQVDYAGTIAQVGEASLSMSEAGSFGQPNKLARDDKIIKDDNYTKMVFYHGLSPKAKDAELQDEDLPVMEVSNPWMTYSDSSVVGLWDEFSTGHKIEDAKYRVIYAREAPVIITAIAADSFKPYTEEVSVSITKDGVAKVFSSCPGFDKDPVDSLLEKADNSMGHGAEKGDMVTLQRVFLPQVNDKANYKYLVIGTGDPPGECTGS